jgi:hypothetical protein
MTTSFAFIQNRAKLHKMSMKEVAHNQRNTNHDEIAVTVRILVWQPLKNQVNSSETLINTSFQGDSAPSHAKA